MSSYIVPGHLEPGLIVPALAERVSLYSDQTDRVTPVDLVTVRC